LTNQFFNGRKRASLISN